MPRTARASVGGVCCHVINRGNGRATVFRKRADFEAFLRLMQDACQRHRMRILGYIAARWTGRGTGWRASTRR